MSGKYLLLSFMGRKTRTKYTTPVAYLREGDTFLMTTDSPWWKNLHGGAPVTLWVKGHEYKGMGDAVTDETEVVCVLGRFLEAQPGYAKYVGLKRGAGGRTDRAQIERRIARERVVRARPIYS
jgi:hypothetical protein